MKLSEAKAICPQFDITQRPDGTHACRHLLDGGMCVLPTHFDCELTRLRQQTKILHTSVSQTQMWQECQRRWAFRYFWKVDPPVTPSWKSLGKAFALCRAKIDDDKPYEIPRDVTDPQDRLRLEVILEEYAKINWRIRGRSEVKCEVLLDPGIEKSNMFPIVALGYADVISEDGKRIGEWKYTVDPDSYDRLKICLQASAYLAGFPKAEEFILCLAKKPKTEIRMATPVEKRKFKKDGTPYADVRLEDETPEEFKNRLRAMAAENSFFTFRTFIRREFNTKAALNLMLACYREYSEARRKSMFYPNYSSCGFCDFREVCETHPEGPGCKSEICSHPHICLKVQAAETVAKEKNK